MIGVTCDATTAEKVIQKTESGPLHAAVCNRWAQHDDLHKMTRGKDFAVLYEWGDDECATPDWKDERRREMAVAKKGNQQ